MVVETLESLDLIGNITLYYIHIFSLLLQLYLIRTPNLADKTF